MNESAKTETRKSAPVLISTSSGKGTRHYETPKIQTFSGDQILQEVDPAQG